MAKKGEKIVDKTSTKPTEFNLSTGSKVVVKPCYGYHIEEAGRIAGGDGTKLIGALASLLITIDGKKCVYEDLRNLPGKDYTKILGYADEWMTF